MCHHHRHGLVRIKIISVCLTSVLLLLLLVSVSEANPDAKRLYDDLLSHYNRLIRPVSNYSQVVTVRLGLHLTQLIDLDLRNQILTTNVWVEHEWMDSKLTWDPDEYGGVGELMVPAEHIWLPDIVLYNNADGDYTVTTMTKALLYHDGLVKWNPPAIFKSYCEIDVRYFPFDMQNCFMKFGSWSYSGLQVDLKHIHSSENLVEMGMNLKDYYPSGEWDILHVPAERHARVYECCPGEFFADIFFNITLRRKTLFYTVNLIIPCVGISCLSVLTFYLPADSGEKVALCITTLLSQTMFFLLMSEIIPSTSLALPLLGKYLLFTMCLVGLSVLVTIVILNVRYRKPSTHRMAPWVRKFFIQLLPRFLLMRVPSSSSDSTTTASSQLATTTATAQPPTTTAATSGQQQQRAPSPAISVSSSNIMMEAISRRLMDQHRLQVLHPQQHQYHHGMGSFRLGGGGGGGSSGGHRRWSRSNSPVHYGSQLLCEIINYNRTTSSSATSGPAAAALPSPPPTPTSPQTMPTIPFPLPPPPPPPLSTMMQPHSGSSGGGIHLSRRSSDDSAITINDGSVDDHQHQHHHHHHYQRPNWPSSVGVVVVPVDVHHRPGDRSARPIAIRRGGAQQQQQQQQQQQEQQHQFAQHQHHHYSNNMELRQRRPPARKQPKRFPLELQKAIRDVQFIQNHKKREDEYDEEDNDWAFIAMVLDRFFLWLFTAASLIGTGIILFTAPALYDSTSPLSGQKFVSAAAVTAVTAAATSFY